MTIAFAGDYRPQTYQPATYWAMEPDMLRAFWAMLDRGVPPDPPPARIVAQGPGEERLPGSHAAMLRDGVAVLPLTGPLFARGNLFTELLGIGTSLELFAQDLEVAVRTPQVVGIMLAIDSPGGEFAGTQETAALVARAAQQKPIAAHIRGIGASAAYWIASQSPVLEMGSASMAGSIGVQMRVIDASRALANAGLEEIVISSSQSPKKDLDPATTEGRADVQAILDQLAVPFIDDVARGRGVTPEIVQRQFGQGGVLVGAAAVAAGLADQLATFSESIARLRARLGRSVRAIPRSQGRALASSLPPQESVMSTPLPVTTSYHDETATTVAELDAAYPQLLATVRAEVAAVARQEGATAERARILAIQALGGPDVAEAVAAAIQDPAMTSAQFAEQLLLRQRAQRVQRIEQLHGDESARAAVASGHAPAPETESPQRVFLTQAKGLFRRLNQRA